MVASKAGDVVCKNVFQNLEAVPASGYRGVMPRLQTTKLCVNGPAKDFSDLLLEMSYGGSNFSSDALANGGKASCLPRLGLAKDRL